MRAAVMDEVGRPLRLEELDDPTPDADQLVLRVLACGICGSDLHLSDVAVPPGRVMGHEFAGEVAAVGPDVDRWREGDLAVGFPVSGCGRCAECLVGNASKCPQTLQLGLQLPGAYAEYVAVGAGEAFRLDGLDHRQGALVEPMAVALHALERTELEAGEPVLVLGAGPVGVAVALWARQLGARHVVVTDPLAHRRELAEAVGATATVDPTSEDVRSAFERVTGTPPTAVIECVGVPGLIQHASDVAATDGRVTIVGVCMQPDSLFPLTAVLKELTLQFVLYYRKADFATTIALLADGRLDPMPLVTGTVDLDGFPDRFEALKHPTTDCKVLLEP